MNFGSIEINLRGWVMGDLKLIWPKPFGGAAPHNKKFGQNIYFHLFFNDELPNGVSI
jgi:hypothetical protein